MINSWWRQLSRQNPFDHQKVHWMFKSGFMYTKDCVHCTESQVSICDAPPFLTFVAEKTQGLGFNVLDISLDYLEAE